MQFTNKAADFEFRLQLKPRQTIHSEQMAPTSCNQNKNKNNNKMHLQQVNFITIFSVIDTLEYDD